MPGQFKHNEVFKNSFEGWCFKLLVSAYREAIAKNSIRLDWNENDITAQLHEYIDSSQFRIKKHIISHVEYRLANVPVIKSRGFADKYPRIDMGFGVFKKEREYKYFAEAKILKEHDGKLKRRYIKTGIDNFLSGKYCDGCLIAYILEGSLVDIVKGLNTLLVGDKREAEILERIEYQLHDQYYESKHDQIGILKHLMFGFTENGDSHARP